MPTKESPDRRVDRFDERRAPSPPIEGNTAMDRHSSQLDHRRRMRRWSAVVLGASALCGIVAVSSANADQTDHKVTLCHATDSHTNPYVSVTVDYHAVVNGGHGNHDGPVFDPSIQTKWGDIIPSFDFGPGAQYPGMNLDDSGQAILANGCSVLPGTTTTTGPNT
jgi:hypothetical protein